MWVLLVLVYVVGGAVTARVILTGSSSGQGFVLSAGEIVLWPLYWVAFLIIYYLGRRP